MMGNDEDSDLVEAPAKDDILEEKKQCIERARSKQFLFMFYYYCLINLWILENCECLTLILCLSVHQGFLRELLTILELQHLN